MTASRKRLRNTDEEIDDCMPISKRINRLHIRQGSDDDSGSGDLTLNNNNDYPENSERGNGSLVLGTNQNTLTANQNSPNGVMTEGNWSHGLSAANQTSPNRLLPPGHHHMVNQVPGPSSSQMNHIAPCEGPILTGVGLQQDLEMDRYSPDLDSGENPHYFNINQVLFLANLERSRRRRHEPS